MGRPYTCPYCTSTKTIWKGYRALANGKVRLRKCKACGRRFTTKQRFPDIKETSISDATATAASQNSDQMK